MAFDYCEVRFGNRMLCNENRTAILERQDRRLVSADLFGNLHDLLLIQSDTGTEYRQGADFIRYREGLDRLARNLSDALTGDQSEAFRLFRNVFATINPATGESIPPDNSSIALPLVPTGIPPGPGISIE